MLLRRVVLLEAHVPGDAGDGGDGAELVDDVARDEVDVVVAQLDARVADALATHLVQLRVLRPRDALSQSGATDKLTLQDQHLTSRGNR